MVDFKIYLNKKNYLLLAKAALVGLVLGLLLGYTVLLKYKSTAILRFPMAGSDYKPFVENTKDPVTLDRFMSDQNLKEDSEKYSSLLKNTVRGSAKWIEPVLKISKQDAKEFGVDPSKMSANEEVMGLQLTATHRDPDTALALVQLQSQYALQAQMKDGIESWVRNTELSALGRLERYEAVKLKANNEISEIQTRLKEFKRVMQQYPETSRADSKPFISLEKGSERYMPIPNQMAVMELRLVDIKEQLLREEREKKKDEIALSLAKQIGESKLRTSNTKAWLDESIKGIQAKLNTVTDERERIAALDMLNSFYELRKKYINGASYILEPRLAERPEQPRPFILATLFAMLAAMAALAWIFKDLIAQAFKQDDETTDHA